MTTQTLSFDTLQAGIRGSVLTPDDDGYDSARAVYNAQHDRYPAMVVRAADVADVIAAVRHARDHDLLLAVRGGGHSIAGFSGPATAGWCSTWAGSARDPHRPRHPHRPGPRPAAPGPTWTTPHTPSAWPPPAGSSPPPGSPG